MSHTGTNSRDSHPFYALVTARPVAVTMMVLAVLVFGWISLKRLPLTLMPDISYPSVTLRTTYEGAAPEEVEQFVSRPIEQAMGVVAGKVSITSMSRAEQSDVVVEFAWDTDMDLAIQDIREKLDMVWLPDDVDRPLILRYDPGLDPVIRLGVGSPLLREGYGSETEFEQRARQLRLLVEELVKPELEKLPGVAAVKLRGGWEEEIRVELSEAELALRGLSIQSITRQLAAENVNVAGGDLKEGRTEYQVRVLSEYASLDDIIATRLQTSDGRWIRLGDVAHVSRASRDARELTRVNGRPAVEIEIHREADANVVQVADVIRRRVFGPGGQPQPARPAAPDTSAMKKQGPEAEQEQRPWWLAGQLAPEGLQFHLLADQSRFIQNSLSELRNSALLGGAFAVLVLFIFLRSLSSTMIIALAIPLSVIAAFGPMQISGLSLNIMSLGGLALGIGMLVDNAIVVLESIARCREEGDSPRQAAIRGAGEVGQAIFAATLTTVAVFAPMVFVEGVAGQIFGDMAQVVVYSLCASLVLAMTFIPMLAALKGQGHQNGDTAVLRLRTTVFSVPWCWKRCRRGLAAVARWWASGSKVLRFAPALLAWLYVVLSSLLMAYVELILRVLGLVAWLLALTLRWPVEMIGRLLNAIRRKRTGPGHSSFSAAYERALRVALRHRGQVLLAAFLPLLIVFIFLTPRIGRELMPVMHQGEFHVDMRLPLGTPLDETAAAVRPVEAFLREQPEVSSLALVAGSDQLGGLDEEQGEHVARLTVRLKESRDPLGMEQRLLQRLRPTLESLPEVESRVSYPVLFSFRTPIEILVLGDNLEQLKLSGERVMRRLESIPQLADLAGGYREGSPELRVEFDRDALGRLGLDLQSTAELLRNKLLGDVETEFRDTDRRVDIRVRLQRNDLAGVDAVRNLVINPGQSVPIPLSAVADVRLAEGPGEIRRVDQQRCIVIRANLSGADLGGALDAIQRQLGSLVLPRGVSWDLVGQSREMQHSLNSLLRALLLAVFLVYVVMASQFESLLHPLVILVSVPLAILGVIPALWLTGTALSVVVLLGAIMLVGIVVNNAIILVDTINMHRRRGLSLAEAIPHAARVRLRPILMTTTTTVLGLMPLLLGMGEGAEMRQPMALTVIVGLLTSTLLTLFVIPTLYHAVESLRIRVTKQLPDADAGGQA